MLLEVVGVAILAIFYNFDVIDAPIWFLVTAPFIITFTHGFIRGLYNSVLDRD